MVIFEQSKNVYIHVSPLDFKKTLLIERNRKGSLRLIRKISFGGFWKKKEFLFPTSISCLMFPEITSFYISVQNSAPLPRFSLIFYNNICLLNRVLFLPYLVCFFFFYLSVLLNISLTFLVEQRYSFVKRDIQTICIN